ncbi:MAG: FkbM family methyltransferase [Planctomycetota bacterium]|nr:FkbM family methyltransferase [Planctomycetota bacterium]
MFVDHPDWRTVNLLQYVAADHLLRNGELSFLQIGAFDGVVVDDMRRVIENEHVRGILVEPQPVPFARLEKRYQGNQHLTLVNAAIDKTSGTRTLYTIPSGDSAGASFDRNHLLKHGIDSADIVEQEVPCLTINEVMQQAGFQTIDLLQIDAEGYDFELVKSIDFRQCSPAILRFEFSHLSRRDIDECLRMLAERGYHFIVEKFDVIAVRQDDSESSVGKSVRNAA